MEQKVPELPEKETTVRGIPKFLEISWREFTSHLTFLPKFSEFSVDWFAYRKIQQFLAFLETFPGN